MAALKRLPAAGKHKMLAASSLVEVTVAMVIIVLAFGITLLVITQVNRSAYSIQKIKCRSIAVALANEARQAKSYLDNSGSRDGISYQASYVPYEQNKNLILLKIELKDNEERTLYHYREIIYSP